MFEFCWVKQLFNSSSPTDRLLLRLTPSLGGASRLLGDMGETMGLVGALAEGGGVKLAPWCLGGRGGKRLGIVKWVTPAASF